MKSHAVYIMAIALLLVSGILFADIRSESFEIVDIVNVGKTDCGPISCPFKWSPDGSKLAFIHEGHLIVSDTLGNRQVVAKVSMYPRRFEWLSDYEILMSMKKPRDSIFQKRLVCYNIQTGADSVYMDFTKERPLPFGYQEGFFEGPFQTLQHNTYYTINENGSERIVLLDSKYKETSDPARNSIYKNIANNQVLIRADQKDTIPIFDKPYADTVQSCDLKWLFVNSQITQLSDSSVILLDTMKALQDQWPYEYGYGVMWQSLNPSTPEALFMLTCDLDDYTSVSKVAIYDMVKGSFTIVDDLFSLKDCHSPQYAPDGRNIALMSDGDIYIVRRREMP